MAIRPALTAAASSQQYRLAQQSHSAIFAAKTQFSGKSTDWPDRADCKSDNLGKFNETSKIESADGTVYKMVAYMEDSNKGDFDACVGKILEGLAKGNGNESGGDDYYCSEYSSSYYDCVNTFADYGDSYVEEYCGVYRSYMDEYCVGSLTKTAASTNKLSKRKFKQLQRAHINGLETLLK